MTTQSGSLSPFQNTSENQTSNVPEEFSFRTMQDDLLAVQKNGMPASNKLPESSTTTEQPSVSTQINAPTQSVPPKEDFAANPNPFLDQATAPAAASKEVPFSETAAPQETTMIEVPTSETQYAKPSTSVYKIIITIIILLVVGIIGLSGYYFWMTRAPKQAPVAAQPAIETTTPTAPVEEPAVVTPPVEKYSATKPNYLTIDAANLSATEIQTAISAVANDLKDLPSQLPYEFVAVDANNNPIAFPIFATAAKLNFSPALLATLGENFSLFIYNDNDNMRLGFSVNILKADVLTTELQKQEKTLPTDISFMFLGATPDITSGLFKDGSYNGIKTRYFNLNAQETLSIDYALSNNNFTLGTSKNTERAILDKISQQNKTVPQQQTQSAVDTTTASLQDSTATNGQSN